MTSTAMTSELEAVNTLLASIGESSINTLAVSGLADVAAARSTLDEISRQVQEKGWHFNTEDEYPLVRNDQGFIQFPSDFLKLISTSAGKTVIQRGTRLYDKQAHSYTFSKDLTGTVVLCLPWDELPQAARHFIMIRAARIFQARWLGSDTQFRFSAAEETSAEEALQDAEGETGKYNMFNDSYAVTSILER